MFGTFIATTTSGSTYVLTLDSAGVRWVRIPSRDSLARATSGLQETLPRLVPGERLLLGTLRSTPITSVAVLPGASSHAVDSSGAAALAGAQRGMAGNHPDVLN